MSIKSSSQTMHVGTVWIEHGDQVIRGKIRSLQATMRQEEVPKTVFQNPIIQRPARLYIEGVLGELYTLGEGSLPPWAKQFPTMDDMWRNNAKWLWNFIGDE